MKEIVITQKELIQAFKLNSKHNLIQKKWKFILAELVIIVISLITSYLLNISAYTTLILIFFIPLILLAIWLFLPLELTRQYKTNPYISIPQQISWDSEFINTHTEFLESKFPWKNFTRILKNDDLILLYQTPACFIIYPVRAFDNQEEMEDFLNLASKGTAT